MRILHVIPWLAQRYGGPPIHVPQVAAALTKLGHRAEIITTNADGRGVLDVPTGHVVRWGGADVTFHPVSPPRWYLTSWPMLSDLRRRMATFDVVHIHYLYRFHGLAAASVARSRGVPYVVQAHGSLDPWHRNQKRRAKDVYHTLVEDRIIRRASAIVCTSKREETYIRDLGYAVPTALIPIGIDADDLRAPGSASFLEAAGVRADARIVTFLGRISAKKGVPLLVDAFRLTAESFPLAHLVIAGPDEEAIGRRLVPRIASMGLSDRISFIGSVAGPQKRGLLQRSEVFVLPSEDESFGIAVAEAMAVGCPVVVSPNVAIEDLVDSTRAGIVAGRDPVAIANAIAAILANPSAARAMGDAGRRAVDERFAWASVAARMESMYEASITANQGQRGSRVRATP